MRAVRSSFVELYPLKVSGRVGVGVEKILQMSNSIGLAARDIGKNYAHQDAMLDDISLGKTFLYNERNREKILGAHAVASTAGLKVEPHSDAGTSSPSSVTGISPHSVTGISPWESLTEKPPHRKPIVTVGGNKRTIGKPVRSRNRTRGKNKRSRVKIIVIKRTRRLHRNIQ